MSKQRLSRVALYCRVSSSGQEDGTSLDEQERIGREYAERHGYRVLAVYHEIADGEEIERPQLRRLLAAGKAGEFEGIIVWKQDRLGRGNKAHEVVFYMCELAGVEPLCVLEPYGDSSEDLMTRGMRGIVSGEEKKNIRLRTQGRRKARARAGKLIPGPRPLYGYRWIDAGPGRTQAKVAYELNPSTAPIVRRIYTELLAGRSLRKIAEGLNEDRVPVAWRGQQWRNSSIRRIVLHPAYCGRWAAYGSPVTERVRTATGGRRYAPVGARPVEERVELPAGTVPAIVSCEEWQAAQRQLVDNRREASRNNRSPESFLLRAGFVFCGHCGRPAYAVKKAPRKSDGERVAVYGIWRKGTDVAHRECPSAGINAAILDDAVWRRVEGLLLDPETIRDAVAKLREEDPTAGELAAIDKALAQVKRGQMKAAEAITLLDDEEAAAPLVARLGLLAKEKAELGEARTATLARRGMWQRSHEILDQLEVWRERVASNLATLSYQLKRDILTALAVRVTLYPTSNPVRYEITASVPLATQSDPGFLVNHSNR